MQLVMADEALLCLDQAQPIAELHGAGRPPAPSLAGVGVKEADQPVGDGSDALRAKLRLIQHPPRVGDPIPPKRRIARPHGRAQLADPALDRPGSARSACRTVWSARRATSAVSRPTCACIEQPGYKVTLEAA